MLWDLILFYSSFWASCTVAFRGVPLSVLQLNWTAVCASKVWECWGFSMFLVFFSWVFYLLFSFCFVGRTSHPYLGFFSFYCIFSSINILFFVFDKKKIKNIGHPYESFNSSGLEIGGFSKEEMEKLRNLLSSLEKPSGLFSFA